MGYTTVCRAVGTHVFSFVFTAAYFMHKKNDTLVPWFEVSINFYTFLIQIMITWPEFWFNSSVLLMCWFIGESPMCEKNISIEYLFSPVETDRF